MSLPLNFEKPKMIPAGDVTFAIYETGPENGLPLLLLHGWPELAYTWKNIAPILGAQGYRVIIPDMIGFGLSSCPQNVAQYSMDILTQNLANLLKSLKIEKAVFIGHDWGSATVWPMAYLQADYVMGAVGICVPHKAPAPIAPLEIFEKRYTDKNYIIEFQDENLPDRFFAGQEKKFFEFIFREPVARDVWDKIFPEITWLPTAFEHYQGLGKKKNVMNAVDRAFFEQAYRRTGFKSSTHYYRNMDKNWEISKQHDITISQPSLMIGADLDAMCPVELISGMEKLCPNLETTLIEACGHWVTWEKPEVLNGILLDWLKRHFPI